MTEGGCDGHSSCFGSKYLDGVYRFSLLSVQLFSNLTLMNLHSFSFSGLRHILVHRLDRILAWFLAFLFLLFLAVTFLGTIETWTSQLLGVEKKSGRIESRRTRISCRRVRAIADADFALVDER